MKDITLCFLIKEKQNHIYQVGLSMKKRGFGKGNWNGAGGKIKPNESINNAISREVLEEMNVKLNNFYKVAEIDFFFPHKSEWNQKVHTFLSDKWTGEPQESNEMSKLQWFPINSIPFNNMWPGDGFWIPKILDKKFVKAKIVFGTKNNVLNKKILSEKVV